MQSESSISDSQQTNLSRRITTATEKPILPCGDRRTAIGIALTAVINLLTHTSLDFSTISRHRAITTEMEKQIMQYLDHQMEYGISNSQRKVLEPSNLVCQRIFRYRMFLFVKIISITLVTKGRMRRNVFRHILF